MELMRDRICPLVVQMLRVSTRFTTMIRTYRVIFVLVKGYTGVLSAECEVFIFGSLIIIFIFIYLFIYFHSI